MVGIYVKATTLCMVTYNANARNDQTIGLGRKSTQSVTNDLMINDWLGTRNDGLVGGW